MKTIRATKIANPKYTLCVLDESAFDRLLVSDSLRELTRIGCHLRLRLASEYRSVKIWLEGGKEDLFQPIDGFTKEEVDRIKMRPEPYSTYL